MMEYLTAFNYLFVLTLVAIACAVAAVLCQDINGKYPDLIPKKAKRNRFRYMKLADALKALGMLPIMWRHVEYVEGFCLSNPGEAFVLWTVANLTMLNMTCASIAHYIDDRRDVRFLGLQRRG